MTEFSDDLAIEHLAGQVLDTSLPRAEWTHAAHFALALWALRLRPELAEPEAFRAIIVALNGAHGTPDTDSSGYHHTITVASLDAARSILLGFGKDEPLVDVLAALVDGPLGRSDWILSYWSRDRLFSVAARRDWIEPDLAPLPW